MNKKICAVFTAIIALFSLLAFKGGSGFNIEVDNSYAVATKASEVDNVAERLSMEPSEVKAYFKENALKFIAVSKDTKTQIRISRFADNFSSSVYDAQNLTDEQVNEMVALYGADSDIVSIIESGSRKYAKTTNVLEDSGGVYTATQYVTVAGGRIYVITCYNPGETTSKEVEDIFSTFYVRDMTERISSYEVQKKWVIPFIVIMSVAVVVVVISLCKRLYEK